MIDPRMRAMRPAHRRSDDNSSGRAKFFAKFVSRHRTPAMEPAADAPRPKMKLKINKVAAKPSASAAAPSMIVTTSTDPELEERTLGVLSGTIEIHETHCSNRGVRQANGRCCEETAADSVLILVRKPFNEDPNCLKFATVTGAVELGFVPSKYSCFLSPLLDCNQITSGMMACKVVVVDGKSGSSSTAPAFTIEIKAAPAAVRRSAAGATSLHCSSLARALGFASVDDLLLKPR